MDYWVSLIPGFIVFCALFVFSIISIPTASSSDVEFIAIFPLFGLLVFALNAVISIILFDYYHKKKEKEENQNE